MSDTRQVAGSLDPAQYASHVTRTAILLEQLARDVSALREETERNALGSNGLRDVVVKLDRELLVYKEITNGRLGQNESTIRELKERLSWLGRLVIGSLITGLVGGGLALVFKALGKM